MMERPLMTADELKSMPKGQFVVMKTGFDPMIVHLKLFFDWGITFDPENPYTVRENGNRVIYYASKAELQHAILAKYPPKQLSDTAPASTAPGGQAQDHTPVRNRPFRKPIKTDAPQELP